jgi:hypothetical protein
MKSACMEKFREDHTFRECLPPFGAESFIFPFATLENTPRSRVLLEKLTVLQLVKKFLAFHGTRRFIAAVQRLRNLSPSSARSIPFIPFIPLIED